MVSTSDLHGPRMGDDLTELLKDHLTGIGNRKYFELKFEESMRVNSSSGLETTVLLLDLDRFKAVNDSLGHAAGDALLCLVTVRMSNLLGAGHTLARLGGDEFGIICGSYDSAKQLAGRLIEVVQRPYLVEGSAVNIGLSIGLAASPLDGDTRSELMKRADLALYEAKAQGRNRFVCFSADMEVQAKELRTLETELRKALLLKQFELQFRPQVDVQTRQLRVLETGIHWRHPRRGLLHADVFMPTAEAIGIVASIGEWILSQACREVAQWPRHVTVAVSLSAAHFNSTRLVGVIEQALERNHISGEQLELEVTEDILLRDGASVRQVLAKLRAMGVKVAIDGFGSGIASLSQMVGFPLDKIKIDRTLVEESHAGVNERAIVRAIAALGEGLGITTLAAGVSTPEHLSRIRLDGCSSVQGYLTSKAVSAADLRSAVETLIHEQPVQEVQP